MSGPCCGDGCRWFGRKLLGERTHGECYDPAKLIYYKYGDAVNSRPEVREDYTCSNWEAEKENAMPSPIMKYFEHSHLPPELKAVAAPISKLAEELDSTLPDGAEKSAGLRKLLEAKDCLVRAALV